MLYKKRISAEPRLVASALRENCTTPKIIMALTGRGYTELSFHLWQRRLLQLTSVGLLCVALAAFSQHQPVTGTTGLLSSLASLNYWHAPGPSWRRDLDVFLASSAVLYFIFAASMLVGVADLGAWLCFACFGICFRTSWQLSAAGDDAWARWHGGGHVSIGAATAFMIAGDCDEWLHRTSRLVDLRPESLTWAALNPAMMMSLTTLCAFTWCGGVVSGGGLAAISRKPLLL